jgi:hypothetical protein
LALLPLHVRPGDVPFKNGLYFFYQSGEVSDHAAAGRIVRIGNHTRRNDRLVLRLKQHYSGHKNGSAFRKCLGGALIRSREPSSACLAPAPGKGHWEKQDSPACQQCKPVEKEVSDLLQTAFSFRCVRIDDLDERNRLEALLIATVAACPVCKPSDEWLGLHAYPDAVRRSGLWNTQFVGGQALSEHDFGRFVELVSLSYPAADGARNSA